MHSSSLILSWAHLAFFITALLPAINDASSPANNVTLGGDAYFVNNAVSLTKEHLCSSASPPLPPTSSSSSGAGRALYTYPIRFFSPQTNGTASFLTRFSFSILPTPLCSSGDGIAFLITSNAESFNQVYHMGLPEIASDDEDNSFIAVEFDTNMDASVGDINGNHVGIDVNSFRSLASVDASSKGINLSNGRHITAWIEYKDSEKVMRIWLSYDPVKPPNPVLDAQIDLSKYLKEYMHVGFTASNGHGSAVHLVDRWQFKTSWVLSTTLPMETVDEGGECIMCSIEELGNVRQPYNIINKKGSARDLALIFSGIAAIAFAVTVFAIIFTFCIWRRRRLAGGSSTGVGRSRRNQFDKVPTRFSSAEIKAATAGFSKIRIIGEGASGTVYHGFFPNGKQVAVKRFNQCNMVDGFVNPFSTEMATLARCLRHRNLVQLLGWCCEQTEWALVYEYLSNGSLDQILYKTSDSVNVLSWEQRVNIVHGVASALIYLHEECDRQIIHRDVKSCNIMLDTNFTAKLGDFGLAEVYEHAFVPREAATTPAGTMGYLAPEYVHSGIPSVKTDVYSFGVVVLEVASGRRPVDDHGTVIVNWVWKLWEKGRLIEAVDGRLNGRYGRLEMERMLKVGLLCVHPNCEKRPSVREAARMLRGEMQVPHLPTKKPKGKLQCQSLLIRDIEELVHSDADDVHACDDSTSWMTPKTHFGH